MTEASGLVGRSMGGTVGNRLPEVAGAAARRSAWPVLATALVLSGALPGCGTNQEGLAPPASLQGSFAGADGGSSPAGEPAPHPPAHRSDPPVPSGTTAPAPPATAPAPPMPAPPASPTVPAPAPGASTPACRAGEVFCSGKVPQTCGADGRWVSGAPCPYDCRGGCVNRFAAVSAGHGAPTNAEGVSEFSVNRETFFSEPGTLLGARGFNVAVMDPASGEALEPVRTFDPWTSPLSGAALNALADYLRALPAGRLVMIAVCDDAGITALNSCELSATPAAKRAVETLQWLGSEKIGDYCYRGAWSFVGITGRGRALAEEISAGVKVGAEVILPAGL